MATDQCLSESDPRRALERIHAERIRHHFRPAEPNTSPNTSQRRREDISALTGAISCAINLNLPLLTAVSLSCTQLILLSRLPSPLRSPVQWWSISPLNLGATCPDHRAGHPWCVCRSSCQPQPRCNGRLLDLRPTNAIKRMDPINACQKNDAAPSDSITDKPLTNQFNQLFFASVSLG